MTRAHANITSLQNCYFSMFSLLTTSTHPLWSSRVSCGAGVFALARSQSGRRGGNAHQSCDRHCHSAGSLGLERGGRTLIGGGGRVLRSENARATQVLDLVLCEE